MKKNSNNKKKKSPQALQDSKKEELKEKLNEKESNSSNKLIRIKSETEEKIQDQEQLVDIHLNLIKHSPTSKFVELPKGKNLNDVPNRWLQSDSRITIPNPQKSMADLAAGALIQKNLDFVSRSDELKVLFKSPYSNRFFYSFILFYFLNFFQNNNNNNNNN